MNGTSNAPQRERCERGLVGPVLLITLGALLLLSKLDVVHLQTTWPLLLVIGGIAALLQRALNRGHNSEVNHV